MNLYALDSEQRLILVTQAEKHVSYVCPECGTAVRRRGGFHRIDHFFHLDVKRICAQNAKTMRHLQTQLVIQSQLPPGEAILEKRFPQINRISDVCWETRGLAFEVQCSPISPQEVIARNQAYRSIGIDVVWILHDHLYNGPRLSAVEHALLPHSHYFTNIDDEGYGLIYDQFRPSLPGQKRPQATQLAIDVAMPLAPARNKLHPLIQHRTHWKQRFTGDLLDQKEDLEQLLAPWIPPKDDPWTLIKKAGSFLIRPYKLWFQYMLEKACR